MPSHTLPYTLPPWTGHTAALGNGRACGAMPLYYYRVLAANRGNVILHGEALSRITRGDVILLKANWRTMKLSLLLASFVALWTRQPVGPAASSHFAPYHAP